jgi:DNA-binding transcriptional regulator YiaG
MVHENAMMDFKFGFISEAGMREFDKLCLPEEALQDTAAQGDITKHADLVTA